MSVVNVEQIMSRDVHAVASSVDAEAAFQHMRRAGIRHLVVLGEHDKIVGVISVRDVAGQPASSLARRSVGDLLQRAVIVASPDMDVAHAARLMHDHVIGSLPVVADGELVGILTTSDILAMVAGIAKPPPIEGIARGGRVLR